MCLFNIHLIVEKWKYNKEYNLYVSTEGRVKDKNKKLVELKLNNSGYPQVISPGKGFISVHKLVMLTFKGPSDIRNTTIDHKDSNKRNNKLSNLEYVSREENLCRASDKLIEPTDGERLVKLLNNKNIFSFEQLNTVLQKKHVKQAIIKSRANLTTIKAKTPEEWADKYLSYYNDEGVAEYKQFVNTIKIKAMKESSYCGYKLHIDSTGDIIGRLNK